MIALFVLLGLATAPVAADVAPETGTCPAISKAIKASDLDALSVELAKKPKDLNTECVGTGPQAQTPLDLVVTRFDNDTARGLASKDATLEDHNKRTEQMLQALIKAGADVNLRDPADGTTPLLVAVLSVSPAGVKALLKAGADPNAKMKNGASCLAIAQESAPDSASIIEMLQKAGAKE